MTKQFLESIDWKELLDAGLGQSYLTTEIGTFYFIVYFSSDFDVTFVTLVMKHSKGSFDRYCVSPNVYFFPVWDTCHYLSDQTEQDQPSMNHVLCCHCNKWVIPTDLFIKNDPPEESWTSPEGCPDCLKRVNNHD